MPSLRRTLALLIALIVLFGQIASVAAMPLGMADGPTGGSAPICGAGTAGHAPAPAPHHDQDCALCPFCAVAHMPAALTDAPPIPPKRAVSVIGAAAPVPPARAPPILRPAHAQPRAPPALT
jgi:hypothetical protein